ncbi:hypothetical protein [Poriferisphaera sp. WC338]|uniref:alpha-amylase family glycosyl hydrolase n=1 Tax=Poriferisphaera sp. WC338 TaxID=3425129 RepID=UPI003D81579D
MRFSIKAFASTTSIRNLLCAAMSLHVIASATYAVDTSAPVTLQYFEGNYNTINARASDIFMAGYGNIWLPPPGRAESGDQSVGYDQYDRFDLGSAGHETLYGTETGLKTLANTLDKTGTNLHIDLVWNHNGFSDRSNSDFVNSGGYPGFWLGEGSNDGDFHGPFEGGDLNGRLSGLIDIDHSTNHQFIRNPVDASNPQNVPAGTQDWWGKLANVADPNNARFYTDQQGTAHTYYDPKSGQTFTRYEFNSSDPTAGDAVPENALGYLMRNAQWLVEEIGVDGFRLDAAKHYEGWVLDYFDRAVYDTNPRKLLDGSTQHVFSYVEALTGDRGYLDTFVQKTIDPNNPGNVGGNRDALDFANFFALKQNLSNNGFQNDWRNLVNAGMDVYDDGQKNGSAGVTFVNSHDDFGADLSNVAHAYNLMQAGNSIVYFNSKEHGEGRDFPKDGRGDALGGVYGDTITTLVNIRNTHGRGDYRERWLSKELHAYERGNAALVLLNNRTDGGYDERTLRVDFAPNTYLVELTGNHNKSGDIAEVLQVFQGNDGNSYVTTRFLRNDGQDQGYLIYGLAKPKSEDGIELSNVDSILTGGNTDSSSYANATKRLTDLHVIKSDNFEIKLETQAVSLNFNGTTVRDADADGDAAIFKFDGGLDLNGNGNVDHVTPNSVAYGFEEFTGTNQAGYGSLNGNGLYAQNIDASLLAEGEHYITIRAFRHRNDGGPAIYEDFKKAIYVDRLPPESKLTSFNAITEGTNESRRVVMNSVDMTANNMHVFMDLGANLTDAQVLALLSGSSQSDHTDQGQWEKNFYGVKHGNHAITIVTFEITGTYNIQRFAGQYTSTILGAGLGDTDFDSNYDIDDVNAFISVFESDNMQFNAAADFDGNGLIDNADILLMSARLAEVGAPNTAINAFNAWAGTIPEPGMAMLFGTVSLLALRRRQRVA